jgi:hypothetical protein
MSHLWLERVIFMSHAPFLFHTNFFRSYEPGNKYRIVFCVYMSETHYIWTFLAHHKPKTKISYILCVYMSKTHKTCLIVGLYRPIKCRKNHIVTVWAFLHACITHFSLIWRKGWTCEPTLDQNHMEMIIFSPASALLPLFPNHHGCPHAISALAILHHVVLIVSCRVVSFRVFSCLFVSCCALSCLVSIRVRVRIRVRV